jgi:hypothetical protein
MHFGVVALHPTLPLLTKALRQGTLRSMLPMLRGVKVPHRWASHGHGHPGFTKMSEIQSLNDLVSHNPDSHLSEEELAGKVYAKLKALEQKVLKDSEKFRKENGISMLPIPDPKSWPKKLTNEMFLCAATCLVLFLIFLYNQYVEFAHELSFEIRDGLFGSSFYFLLGLHGTHVIIGSGMLAVLVWMSWIGAITGNSGFFRGTSIYVHLVDLVFVFIVFIVYGGLSSPTEEIMIENNVLSTKKYVYVDEAGNAKAQLLH